MGVGRSWRGECWSRSLDGCRRASIVVPGFVFWTFVCGNVVRSECRTPGNEASVPGSEFDDWVISGAEELKERWLGIGDEAGISGSFGWGEHIFEKHRQSYCFCARFLLILPPGS